MRQNAKVTRTMELDYFVPVVEKPSDRRYRVKHRWEGMKVHEVTVHEVGAPWSDSAIGMAIEFPAIAPQFWFEFAARDNNLLVVERPGHAPYLVSKSRIDQLHADGPAYGGMVEVTNPVAFDGDPNRGYLLQLVATDVEIEDPDTWDNDSLIDEVHRLLGGAPFDQHAYNQGLRRLPKVRAVIEDWKAGRPLSPPWVRWTYGQTIVLAKTIDILMEAQDPDDRSEGRLTFEVAVETVLQGSNNHY